MDAPANILFFLADQLGARAERGRRQQVKHSLTQPEGEQAWQAIST